MSQSPEYTGPPGLPSRLQRSSNTLSGLSLAFGLVAVFGSPCLIGALFAILGLLFGVLHLQRESVGQAMAWVGISLSALGGILSTCFIALLMYFIPMFREGMTGMMASADFTIWEGVEAPDFEVSTLDGASVKLSDMRGRRVIVDMWATWCGPCRMEIPHFNSLAREYKDTLTIIGISDEAESKLREFIEEQPIEYLVASAELPSPYGDVTSIPTTFFIDRNGIIDKVLVGYHDLETLTLHATAPDFEGEPLPAPGPPKSELEEGEAPLQLEALWTVPLNSPQSLCTGDWDQDGHEDVIVADQARARIFDAAGSELASIVLPGRFDVLEFGFHREKGPRLLGYTTWGNTVTVVDGTGSELWSYSALTGVDGAHWGDLDGDGSDEMIVGMNGFGGLHAVSPDGDSVWKVRSLGNVWSQAIVPATGNQPASVVATEAAGSIRVFDAGGNALRTLRPGNSYFAAMTASSLDSSGLSQILAVGDGMTQGGSLVHAMDLQGRVAWTSPVARDHGAWRGQLFACGDADGDGLKDWVFRNQLRQLTIASHNGTCLGTVNEPIEIKGFRILSDRDGRAMLAIITTAALSSFSLTPGAAEEAAPPEAAPTTG